MNVFIKIFGIIFIILVLFIYFIILIQYKFHRTIWSRSIKFKYCDLNMILDISKIVGIEKNIEFDQEIHYIVTCKNDTSIVLDCYECNIYIEESSTGKILYSPVFEFLDFLRYKFIFKFVLKKKYRNLLQEKNYIKGD